MFLAQILPLNKNQSLTEKGFEDDDDFRTPGKFENYLFNLYIPIYKGKFPTRLYSVSLSTRVF